MNPSVNVTSWYNFLSFHFQHLIFLIIISSFIVTFYPFESVTRYMFFSTEFIKTYQNMLNQEVM